MHRRILFRMRRFLLPADRIQRLQLSEAADHDFLLLERKAEQAL